MSTHKPPSLGYLNESASDETALGDAGDTSRPRQINAGLHGIDLDMLDAGAQEEGILCRSEHEPGTQGQFGGWLAEGGMAGRTKGCTREDVQIWAA